jgi:hypothetical protein
MRKILEIPCLKIVMAIYLAVAFTPFGLSQQAHHQKACLKNLTSDFIQDGRDYTCFVKPGEKCSFHVTLYGQSTYRIIACSDKPGAKIQFRLIDKNQNLLFDNGQHEYSTFWDFNFKHTIDCTIEVTHVDPSSPEGFIYLVLAYKKD